MIDKDVLEGQAKQVQGKVQDAMGDVTGDADDDVAGKARQAEGKVQEGFGRAKDAVRDSLNKDQV